MRLNPDLSRRRRAAGLPAGRVPGRKNLLPADPPGRAPRPLTPADQEQVRELIWLAYHLAWQFARRHARDVPADELTAEALYSLTLAAGLYDDTRRVPFRAYAVLVMRTRLRRYVEAWRRYDRFRPLPDRPAGHRAWEPTDHKSAAGGAAREMCERVRRVLPARLYEVLELFHAQGYTIPEIAARLGVTRQRIKQLILEATHRAREHFPHGVREP